MKMKGLAERRDTGCKRPSSPDAAGRVAEAVPPKAVLDDA